MEFLDNISPQLSPLTLGVALAAFALSFLFLKLVLSDDSKVAIDYTVPIPEQCKSGWKGVELDDPQIKVRRSVRNVGKRSDGSIGAWIEHDTMLLSRQWQAPRPSQPNHSGWD